MKHSALLQQKKGQAPDMVEMRIHMTGPWMVIEEGRLVSHAAFVSRVVFKTILLLITCMEVYCLRTSTNSGGALPWISSHGPAFNGPTWKKCAWDTTG